MAKYDLSGKNAIVTGSSSGIGAAIAMGFAKNGANVVVNGLESEDEMQDSLEALRAEGVKVIYSAANMLEPESIREMVAKTKADWGSIDFLVNNAGIQHKDRIENFPDKRWEMIIGVNLSSAFYMTKAVIPHMREACFGRIVNIASAHGLRASAEKSAYVAAKHGIMGLTKVVALENAEENITVNTVCPGWVETPLVQKQIQDNADKNGTSYKEETEILVGEKQPNKRFQSPESIAQAVLYFCDPDNNFTTGSHLSVDGGWTAK